jgi:hypothetical protein
MKRIRSVVRIPRDAKILLLEDDPNRIEWFHAELGKFLDPGLLHIAFDAAGGIHAVAAADPPFDLMFLDHDLSIEQQSMALRPDHEFNSGSSFAQSFVEQGFVANHIIIHSWNPAGAQNMVQIFENYGIRAAYLPFGSFKIEGGSNK